MFFRSSKPKVKTTRTFAIGDIHGCANELSELLEKLELRADDTLVFLGDYVDRGPDSRRVIDIIIELRSRVNVVTLMGNHEQMLVDFLDRPESAGAGLFILNGGGATLSDYAGPGGTFEFPDSHVEFLRGLKLYYENDTHFFVHAGVPNLKLKDIDFENEAMTMMWVRQSFLNSSFRWEKKIVHGHTPVRSPEILSNRINIDTGCVYDGHLTAIELTSAKLYQVEKQVKGETERVPHRADESRVAVRFTGRMPVQARLVGGASYDFETLNYNKFGLLLRELGNSPDGLLKVGDRIEGRIGPEGDEAVYFKGEVMRTESRGANRLYGVKTDAISDGHLGYESVERDKK